MMGRGRDGGVISIFVGAAVVFGASCGSPSNEGPGGASGYAGALGGRSGGGTRAGGAMNEAASGQADAGGPNAAGGTSAEGGAAALAGSAGSGVEAGAGAWHTQGGNAVGGSSETTPTGGTAVGGANSAGDSGAAGDAAAGGSTASAGTASGGTALGGAGAAGASGGVGGRVCGDSVCSPGEVTRECPADCALTYAEVGVDLQGAASPYVPGWRGVMWQLGKSVFMGWDQARAYCNDLTLAGYTDWVLPTMAEHQNLLGSCMTSITTGDTTCTRCAQSPVCALWFPDDQLATWNSHTQGTCCAGGVSLDTGRVVYGYYKTNAIRARCVRRMKECSSTCMPSETCVQNRCVPTPLAESQPHAGLE